MYKYIPPKSPDYYHDYPSMKHEHMPTVQTLSNVNELITSQKFKFDLHNVLAENPISPLAISN